MPTIRIHNVSFEPTNDGLLLKLDPPTLDVGILAAACEEAAGRLRMMEAVGMANGGQRLSLEAAKVSEGVTKLKKRKK